MTKCRLQAHRGVSSDCPENTMSAYREAVTQGYALLELDPKFTRDGKCVLLHNRTINRTARDKNGNPPTETLAIESLTYEEAAVYEYGSWFSPAFCGERLPLLREVLAFAKETGIPVKLDHVVQSFSEEQRRILYDEIEEAEALSLVGFTGSSLAYLDEVLHRFPDAILHYDGPWNDDARAYFSSRIPPERLTVWLRYDNQATAWSKVPPITADLAADVKHYGSLGLWLLSTEEEYVTAVTRYHADVIETNGTLKPQCVKALLP